MPSTSHYDVAVIGAGFGGLAAALRLAEGGARVVVFERLNYPGGCASTFHRNGYHFEAGATLFSGLGPDQLFGRWIARHDLDVAVDWLDPLVELRTPAWQVTVRRDRAALVDQLARMAGAAAPRLRHFFTEQARVADVLWSVLDDPRLLPPFDWRAALHHLQRVPHYLPVARVMGRTLDAVLARHGLEDFAPLRLYLDALCQITVQCSAAEAEAPFALGAMDYYYRGTGHVRGGIGHLATGLVTAIRACGGEVRFASRVRRLARNGVGWRLESRSDAVEAKVVVGNLLPDDLQRLCNEAAPRFDTLTEHVAAGWGACMLYLGLRGEGLPPEARHLQLVQEPTAPLIEGNHLFCSISGSADGARAPHGGRTATISTHVPLAPLLTLPEAQQASYIAEVQARMRRGIERLVPEWDGRTVHTLTASPRTFARFTGRSHGYVGGIPRRRGWTHYLASRNPPVRPGLFLVGDSVFPGQSTLATALGGVKVADGILNRRALR